MQGVEVCWQVVLVECNCDFMLAIFCFGVGDVVYLALNIDQFDGVVFFCWVVYVNGELFCCWVRISLNVCNGRSRDCKVVVGCRSCVCKVLLSNGFILASFDQCIVIVVDDDGKKFVFCCGVVGINCKQGNQVCFFGMFRCWCKIDYY